MEYRFYLKLTGVIRVGVSRSGNWRCHLYFFLEKKLMTF